MIADWWKRIQYQVEKHPDDPCLTLGPAGEEKTYTYSQLNHFVTKQSKLLREVYPDGPGPVGVIVDNTFNSIAAVLGAIKAGCAVLFVGRNDPDQRIMDQFSAAAVAAHTGPHISPELSVTHGRWSATHWSPDERPVLASDIAFLFPTSGTTAASKLVAQTHEGTSSNALGVASHHKIKPGDVILGGLPIHHVNGWHFSVVGSLAAGAHVVVPPTISPLNYLDLISKHRPRIASVVPTVLEALTTIHDRWRPPTRFEYFVSAAAPLRAHTARAVWTQFGCRVVQSYGLTETINFSAALPTDLTSEEYGTVMLEGERLPIGIAFPGQELTIRSPADAELPEGRIGEVCMRGSAVMAGYLNNHEQTSSALRNGWFHSGDLGYAAEEFGHRMFFLTGRIKNIVKIRGQSVSLDEIDQLSLGVAGVRDALALSSSDPLEGVQITLLLVGEGSSAAVEDRLRQLLPKLHRPWRYVEVDRIPRTQTGKVLRREAERLADLPM